MPEVEQTKTAETTVFDTLHELLRARGATEIEVRYDSRLTADLGMDSLELAELSAVLEDELGHEPYAQGVVPMTVVELIAFYDS